MDLEMYAITTDSLKDSLSHHGVKGMKWGVRKSKHQRRREKYRKHRAKLVGEDGNMTKYGQKYNYKRIKKGLDADVVQYGKHLSDEYVDAYARKKASANVSVYMTEHGKSNKLSKRAQTSAEKKYDKMERDFHESYTKLDKLNKQMVEDMLGKYGDRKLGKKSWRTAEDRLIEQAERYVEETLAGYGSIVPYYMEYLE